VPHQNIKILIKNSPKPCWRYVGTLIDVNVYGFMISENNLA